MDSLSHLWGQLSVIYATATLLQQSSTDSVFPFCNTFNQTVSKQAATLPRMSETAMGDFRIIPIGNQLMSEDQPVLHTSNSMTLGMVSDEPGTDDGVFHFDDQTPPATVRILRSNTRMASRLPSNATPDAFHCTSDFTQRTDYSDGVFHPVIAHYLWDSRRRLADDLTLAETVVDGLSCCQPISIMLRSVREVANRLFQLLPLGRLSDYLVPSEATTANLEEAAKVAAQVQTMVEDLYLLCAGEKRGKGERGSAVSLGRLRTLNSVFAEPSGDDKSSLEFLESFLVNPAVSSAGISSYLSLEDALQAVQRIKPMKSRLEEVTLRDRDTINDVEESSLLFTIAAQVASPKSNHSLSSDVLPLFEMLTAPFMVLSTVGATDVTLDTANPAGQTLLNAHTSGPFSGFRFFVPSDAEMASGGAQSCETARWFQELASDLQCATAATDDENATFAWLCGPGSFREVCVRQTVDGQETLLTALQQGTVASSTGVPIAVVDMPSGTIYGVHAYSWRRTLTSSCVVLHFRYVVLQRTAATSREEYRITVSSSPTPASLVGQSTSASFVYTPVISACGQPVVVPSIPLICSTNTSYDPLVTLGDPPTPAYVSPVLRSGGHSFSSLTKTQSQKPFRNSSLIRTFSVTNTNLSISTTTSPGRGNDVDWVALSTLQQRLERGGCRVCDVLVGSQVPGQFICNDSLILHVIQAALQYNKTCGLPCSTVMIHRCGIHIVIDLVPHHVISKDVANSASYEASVAKYYEQWESHLKPAPLRDASDLLLKKTHAVPNSSWMDRLMLQSGILDATFTTGYDSQQGSRRPSFGRTAESGIVTEDSLIRLTSHVSSFFDPQRQGIGQPYVPDLKSAGNPFSATIPDVWAAHAEGDYPGELSMVTPTQYISAHICELLVSIKAAVVVMSTGATTIAFPYLAKDKVDLLKQMNLVNQPLSAAADLGIVELNRMADNKISAKQLTAWEEDRRCEVRPLGYSMASASLTELKKKSTYIPSNLRDGKSLAPLALPKLMMTDSTGTGCDQDTGAYHGESDSSLPLERAAAEHHPHSTHGTSDLPLLVAFPSGDTESSDPNIEYDTNVYTSMLGDPNANTSFADLTSLPASPLTASLSPVDHAHFPNIRTLIYYCSPCDSFISWYISLGHGATLVSDSAQMAGILQCGIEVYDLVIVEWSNTLITPEVMRLLHEARELCFSVPVYLTITGASLSDVHAHSQPEDRPAFPTDLQRKYIISGTDFGDACMRHRPQMRSSVRLGRILKHLKGDATLRYQIRRSIGSGSFGDVYEVVMYASKGRLAMKRIPLGVVTTERMEQLYKEATIMRELDHRNIVQLSHFTCDSTHFNLFMELCDYTLKDVLMPDFVTRDGLKGPHFINVTSAKDTGKPFQSSLASHPITRAQMANINNSPPLRHPSNPPALQNLAATTSLVRRQTPSITASDPSGTHRVEYLQTVRDLLSAVHYLHSHDVVHRDIKPQNILFLNGVAKLADFGSATTVSDRQNALHAMKGTVPYMAPEVFLGEPYRKSCDIWSLGILIGEIIGLRFAHTALLHFPALQAFYKSFSENESIPVVVTNASNAGLQKHFTDELVESVLAALQEAREVAKDERERRRLSQRARRPSGSQLIACRTVFAIEVDAKLEQCVLTRHSLSASLVELLESTFYRNPERRVTAEQLLEHPIANDKEWLLSVKDEVTKSLIHLRHTAGHLQEGDREEDDEGGLVDLSFEDFSLGSEPSS